MREPIPIACSLPAEQQTRRRSDFAEVFHRGLLGREPIPNGIRLRFEDSPSLARDLAGLTDREKQCCPFFDFEFDSGPGELILDVTVPPEAVPVLERLFG